jgi:hypothetical protein
VVVRWIDAVPATHDMLWVPPEPEWLRESSNDEIQFLKSLRTEDDMSTNLVTTSPNAVAAPIEWDRELRGATYLVKSGLCPQAIKTPEAALFIILAGRDLGLSPVASLRNIHIIQGKVELSADMQLSLFASRGGRFRWLEVSDTAAVIELHAPWLLAPHVSKWTMADATRAGLAGSENYRKYPKAMLRSRTITAGLKDIGFDATAGVYAPGEIGSDETVVEGEEVVSVDAVETGEEPSAEQLALLEKMLRSRVWTDNDREAYAQAALNITKRQMSTLLDEIIETGKQRKAARSADTEARDLAEDKRIADEELALGSR